MTTAIDEAKRHLDWAVINVARSADLLTELRHIRVKEGVVVNLSDWRELQDALGEWRAATHAFLEAVRKEAVP